MESQSIRDCKPSRDMPDDMYRLEGAFHSLEPVAFASGIRRLEELHSECWKITQHHLQNQERRCSLRNPDARRRSLGALLRFSSQ